MASTSKNKSTNSIAKKTSSAPGQDHLGSRESFQFALHVATLSVLIVAFVTMVSQIGQAQTSVSKAVRPAPVVVEEEIIEDYPEGSLEANEAVLGMEDYGDEYYYDEEEGYFEDEMYYGDEYYEGESEIMGMETEVEQWEDPMYADDSFYYEEDQGEEYYDSTTGQ
jgi:hypothetical protein